MSYIDLKVDDFAFAKNVFGDFQNHTKKQHENVLPSEHFSFAAYLYLQIAPNTIGENIPDVSCI